MTFLSLPSPSWQGSATFVPHVTDVLAAQKSTVNTESADSSLQWDVRDLEVEKIIPEPSKCCSCSASGAPWLTTQQAELSCRDFGYCRPTAGTRCAEGWRKDEGQWDNTVHFPGMSNPGSLLWLWQNHPGEWVLLSGPSPHMCDQPLFFLEYLHSVKNLGFESTDFRVKATHAMHNKSV